jgi:5-methyltetrahydropteroyltriglutamate--homocysteine methyltransferase
MLHQSGLDYLQLGDFSPYDHVLDISFMLGNVPQHAKRLTEEQSQLNGYFSLVRGTQSADSHCFTIKAAKLTKWFDTNYHYLVPELNNNVEFALNPHK